MNDVLHTALAPACPRPSPAEDSPSVEHQVIYPYGVGIDTHSKFIAVCVLVNIAGSVRRHEKTFLTDWVALKEAYEWAFALVRKSLGQSIDPATFRYCIESTGTYHLPVLRAWGGVPSVVNPLLAGPTRRKTDVLDARLLAHHSITGIWKASFIPTEQAQVLRVLWADRAEHARKATRASNRINNIILRFGHTIAARTSIRSAAGESLVTALIEGDTADHPGLCPDGLPEHIRGIIAALQSDLVFEIKAARKAMVEAREFIKARDWPTGSTPMSGQNLLEILETVPGVGPTTAITWLAEVTDPRRFQLQKQVSAYAGCDPSLKVSAGKVTSMTRRAGNNRLHQALLYAAQGLINRPEEPLGQWGQSIRGRHKKGGYKKACGALARRVASALWHVHSLGKPFSYDQYKLACPLTYMDTPLREVVTPRTIKLLAAHGIKSAPALGEAYTAGRLGTIPGFGETSLKAVRAWLDRCPPQRLSTQREAQPSEGTRSTKRVYNLDSTKVMPRKPRKVDVGADFLKTYPKAR
jgi:transposase